MCVNLLFRVKYYYYTLFLFPSPIVKQVTNRRSLSPGQQWVIINKDNVKNKIFNVCLINPNLSSSLYIHLCCIVQLYSYDKTPFRVISPKQFDRFISIRVNQQYMSKDFCFYFKLCSK